LKNNLALRVGIDAHMVGGEETGNESYVRGLVDGLGAVGEELELLVYYVRSPWTTANARARFEKLATENPLVRLGVELPLRTVRERLDVLHMTYASPAWSAAPVVVTVHDICYATNPEWFSPRDVRVLSTMVPRSIRKSAHVITVSESARRQIMETYRVPEGKISAIPNGPGPGAAPISEDDARKELAALGLDVSRPYLLAVGNLQPRKNLVRLIEAFRILIESKRHDIDLVVVGPQRYRAADVLQAAAGPIAERIRFTGYATDRQLAACYRCSTAFVFPSLYEGFGLPALEAMAHGTPVASSDVDALREVCGDAAVMFDPRSTESIANAMALILDDADLRRRLSAAGLARAALFSWEKSARLTLDVYRKAVG
jgi:glycosyltransferase involved in cell wall biosynthesis